MGINQKNLPLELFDTDEDGTPNIDEFDCDPPATDNLEAGDGLITFRDLECAEQLWIDGRPPRPLDILDSGDWVKGQTDPDVEHLDSFESELVGWSFRAGDNRPVENTGRFPSMHGTSVSGVLAAQGDHRDNAGEPVGIPGAAWRVSLLPLASGSTAVAEKFEPRRGSSARNLRPGHRVRRSQGSRSVQSRCRHIDPDRRSRRSKMRES